MGVRNIRRRAVGEEQKEERRQAILEVAWRLFQRTPYEALTIAEVAEALELAKGTVFLYFRTKEALFLAIVEQQLTNWFAEVDAELSSLATPADSTQVVGVICRALETRPGLVRLLAILHTLLERNIELIEAVRFKHFLLEHMTQTGTQLERCLPFLASGTGTHLLLQSHAMVIGFWHLSDPAPVVREALQRPELRVFDLQFAPEFSNALQALLCGLEATSQRISQQEE
ncbi:MAG TPA: TetR family transcriptional regulator [Ktedonobacteraceae bacterium]|nr:TetR family transcriptional regulator [Ktedonobacteraceae bacterium]